MATAAIPGSYETISRVSPSDKGIVNVDLFGPAQSKDGSQFRRMHGLRSPHLIAVLSAQVAVRRRAWPTSFSFNKIGTDGAAPGRQPSD